MIDIDTSTWMMIFFVILLVASIWKIYAFLPNEELPDDDTTEQSQKELTELILKIIKDSDGELDEKMLFDKIIKDKNFDSKHYWRFNQNRLVHLLQHYYLENENVDSIKSIYKDLKAK